MTKTYKRKKYTEIEAFVYNNQLPIENYPKWFLEYIIAGKIEFLGRGNFVVDTSNGKSHGKNGDYVVKNGQGCVYPVLHDVFLELYEEVK